MPAARPLVLLFAAGDRATLIESVRACRALPRDALSSWAGAMAGRERLALVSEAETVHAALDLALARLPALTGRRWVDRASGISFAADFTPGRVAFVFPGQGSQHPGMLADLRRGMPAVRRWFESLDEAARAAGRPLHTPLLDPDGSDAELAERRACLHDMERGAQLGAAAELALFEVVSALGLTADVHVGHSNGEHAAVIAAGRVDADRDETCRGFVSLGAAGAALPPPATPEGLLAVSALRRARLAECLDRHPSVRLAMDNCPNQSVAGGARDALSAFAATVVAAGGVAVPMPFARAYHTPLFADWQATLGDYYRALPLVEGKVPVYSCLTSAPLPADADACRQLMTAQWTSCVRFGATIERLHDEGVRTFVEIGPGATLTAFIEDTLRGRPHVAVSTSSPMRGEVAQLCHLVGELFVAGLPVAPSRLWPLFDEPSPLDVAAGVHRRLIAEARARLARAAAVTMAAVRPPALLADPRIDHEGRLIARRHFTRSTDRYVDDHALGRPAAAHQDGGFPLPVLPFTLSVEIAAEAGRVLAGAPVREVRDVRASRWLALDFGELTVDVSATATGEGVRVALSEPSATVPGPAFEATVVTGTGSATMPHVTRPDGDPPRHWSARSFYERYAFHGPSFQGLTEIHRVGPGGVEATVTITTIDGLDPARLEIDPAMLDCAGQLVAFWLLDHEGRAPAFGIFPFAADRIVVGRPPATHGTPLRATCQVVRTGATTDATCVFEALDGGVVAAVAGLKQRVLEFPEPLARTIFAGDPAARGALAAIDPEVYQSSWGIWQRALAHLRLSIADRERWREHSPDAGARLRWLLDRV